MRDIDSINEKLQTATEPHIVGLLYTGLNQNVDQIARLLSEAYLEAFQNALRHRPNGINVDKFETLTWLAGSDLNVADVPWLQYGMPRIRRMAIELQLPWIPQGNITARLKAARMANGLQCEERCVRCFSAR